MTRFFTHERFGRPQFFAGLLLLAFLSQAVWLIHSELRASEFSASRVPNASEQVRIAAGWGQLHGFGIAGAPNPDSQPPLPVAVFQDNDGFDAQHSPLLSVVTAAPLLAWPQHLLDPDSFPYWRWLPRIPFLAVGVFLGASLWYVARRLCGNSGGFLALTLYCFSPSMIQASAVWHTEPEILAAWGAFGAIFTAIAVAHTLYAPREVILWNWRRIVLLGISLAIAVGSQFSMIIVVPIAFFFLLYLAPIRRGAALTIWTVACLVALAILFATYFFHPRTFSEGMRHASFWGATWRGFTVPGVYPVSYTHLDVYKRQGIFHFTSRRNLHRLRHLHDGIRLRNVPPLTPLRRRGRIARISRRRSSIPPTLQSSQSVPHSTTGH